MRGRGETPLSNWTCDGLPKHLSVFKDSSESADAAWRGRRRKNKHGKREAREVVETPKVGGLVE